MALSTHPAPHARARAPRSTSSDRRSGRRLLTAFVLARTSLLVLAGRASATVACGGHDGHRVEHRSTAGRRLDVVLAGSTDATTGHRCLLVMGRDGASPEQQSPTVLPREERVAPRVVVGRLDAPPRSEEGRPLGGRRTGPPAATQPMSTTLVVAGLIGLLGVCGAATLVVHSVTGPVRRAVRVLQAPVRGRRGHRERPTAATRPVPRGDEPSPGTRNAVAVVASVVQHAHLVTLDATIESARSGGVAEAVSPASTPAATSVATTRYAAARSRAFGPTTALWHAVELDRLAGAIDGACETTVCGSLVRVSTEQQWPVPARDVCPACSTLAH